MKSGGRVMNWLQRWKQIIEGATRGPWESFKVLQDHGPEIGSSSYKDNEANSKHIAFHNPEFMAKVWELVKAVEKCEKDFMAIDDGFFKGLVPPEFAPVSKSLRDLYKAIETSAASGERSEQGGADGC